MTSEKKAQANRRNALKSTGPKTPEGKAAVRLNALKHGLLSQEMLLPGEDEEALRELGQDLRDELQPVGELENLLVERIIASYWRLRRLGRVEAGIFAWQSNEVTKNYREPVRIIEVHHRLNPEEDDPEGVPELTDKIGPPKEDQEDQETRREVEEKEASRDAETPMLGRAFIHDADGANAFSKLSRYETTIERSLFKALHELQRLQAARRADGNAPPPVAIDVEVSGVTTDEH